MLWAATGHLRFTTGSEEEGGAGGGAVSLPAGPSAPARVDYAALDRRLAALAAQPDMVGLAVAMIENGEIRFVKAYGETLHDSGEPAMPDTVFRWASLSKGVAADMVVKLADEGKLSLYEPVSRYAASLRLPGGDEYKATVSDLLSHRLGLYGHAHDAGLEDGDDPKLLRGRLATLNSICPPGSCHAYQNVAYDAASEVVERATGLPYREAARRMLFRPLGMTGASLSLEELVGAESWARPHRGSPPRPLEPEPDYYRVPAAGGVNGSIKDLALWMAAQMGASPQVLAPRTLENLQSPRARTGGEDRRMRRWRERLGDARYALGWRVYNYAGRKVVGHRGAVAGYRAFILFDPERRSGVAGLWNSSSAKPWNIQFEVMDEIYRLPRRDWLELGEGAEAGQSTISPSG